MFVRVCKLKLNNKKGAIEKVKWCNKKNNIKSMLGGGMGQVNI